MKKRLLTQRARLKFKLLEYKGNKCQRCEYDKIEYPNAFAFHHVDPKMKSFTISQKSASFEELCKEVDKCLLLCVRCHAEIHGEGLKILKEEYQNIKSNKYETVFSTTLKQPKEIKYCLICNKPAYKKYCSFECSNIGHHKVPHPEAKELETLVLMLPITKIAKQFNVSDNTIRNWCDQANIKRPRHGYWLKHSKSSI